MCRESRFLKLAYVLKPPIRKKNTWGASYSSASYAPLDLRGLVSYFRAKSESLVLIAVILIAHREFISNFIFCVRLTTQQGKKWNL